MRNESMELLKVEHLSKKFKDKLVINDISFEINHGEIVGFIGPNGSGKTTSLRLITNLIYPTNGSVHICGYDVIKEREKALEKTASVIEYPAVYPFLSGMDHLKIIAKVRHKNKEEINQVIKLIGLERDIKRNVAKYSLGMKQRLGIGMCILSNPELLILDEPTNGLDPSAILELRELLKDLNEKNHMTIFFSSHNLTEIAKLCHRIIFLKEGKIVDIKKAEEILFSRYKIIVDNKNALEELLISKKINYVFEDNAFLIHFVEDTQLHQFIKDIIRTDTIMIKEITKVDTDIEAIYKEVYRNETNSTN